MRRVLLLALVVAVIVPAFSLSAQAGINYEERTLTHAGRERRYLLYVPPNYTPAAPVPLVLLFHGGGGSPDIYETVTRFGEKARAEGFILALPAGTGRLGNRTLLTWNAGHCCGYALDQNVDDVGFVRELVRALQAEFTVDAGRIYAAGHSNGAILSYRLAAELPDVFAAVGIVAGTIGGYPTPDSKDLYMIPIPKGNVSVIHIHGMADQNLRYEGGENADDTLSKRNDLSVAESIRFWLNVNRCNAPPAQESRDNGMVLVDNYACETTKTNVKLISIVDGGHSWPGGLTPRRRSGDAPSQRVNATDEIWAFFEANHR